MAKKFWKLAKIRLKKPASKFESQFEFFYTSQRPVERLI